jgi:dihydrofolate reductase
VGRRPNDGVPIHVLTHHTEDGDVPPGNTTFHTDVASWAAAARESARGRPVMVHGAAAAQALIAAGELDEMELHLVPVLLGAGRPLFAHGTLHPVELELVRRLDGHDVTHLRYSVRQ